MKFEVKLIGIPESGFVWQPSVKEDGMVNTWLDDESHIRRRLETTFIYDDVPAGTVLRFESRLTMLGDINGEHEVVVAIGQS